MLITLASATSSSFSKEVVNVLVYPEYPPFLHNKDDVIAGLFIDIVALTLDSIAKPYKLTVIPLQRAMRMAAAGEGIVVGIVKKPERAQKLNFSKPFYQERLMVYSNINKPLPVENVEQLDGLTVGTIFGWSYGTEFDQARLGKRFRALAGDLKTGFHLLALGRLEAMVHAERSSRFIIQRDNYQSLLKANSKPFHYADIHIAVGKNSFL